MTVIQGAIRHLIKAYQEPKDFGHEKSRDNFIHVDEIASRLAFFYERLRNIIEYKEDFLLRRSAIERILKRRLLIEGESKAIAKPLVHELVRAGYLENNSVLITKIQEVEDLIDRYLVLEKKIRVQGKKKGQERQLIGWIRRIMASEIEDLLTPSAKEEAIVQLAYQIFKQRISFTENHLTAEERDIQLWLAVYRHLYKSDYARLSFIMWKLYFPQWRNSSEDDITKAAYSIEAVKHAVDTQIKHHVSRQLNRIGKKYAAIFTVLEDVLEQHGPNIQNLYHDSEKLTLAITEAAHIRYQNAKIRLRTSIFHAVLYLFMTKFILAFIIELPYERLFLGEVNYLSLGTNVIFHPVLMIFIALTIRVPSDKNTEKIIHEISSILYAEENPEIEKIIKPVKRGWLHEAVFNLIYILMFGITFGGIGWLLYRFQFNIVSGSLFIFFLCLVSYFGIKLRRSARELVILDEKGNIFTALFDFFSIPILTSGRWLSRNFSKINVFIFVLDIIIEAPFKLIIEVIEEWLAYIKEKREELY